MHDGVLRALDDVEQGGHRRDLLALLLEEPVHELLRDEVALLAGRQRELLDLAGDPLLLVEREPHGLDHVRERRLWGLDGGDDDRLVGVDEVLHHHHRVVPLLQRLAVEVRGELRKGLRVVVDGDRDVLLRRGELVADLVVELLHEGGVGHPLRR